ncbi:MAG: glycosyltransferase family 4 protein [Chloroflexi bacterium]|nr:glycosyltransferase family 4 protein [Chloroflexota bacterium]
MRIAYVCADPGVPVFGTKGCSIHVQEVIRALRHHEAQIELFAARRGGRAPADLEWLRVHDLPAVPKGDFAAREQAALAANDELYATLERAPRFDLVYERYSLWSHAGMAYARAQGARGVLEVNAPLIEEQAEHRGLCDRAAAEWVATRVFGAASVLIAVSAEVAAYLGRFPVARGRVHVVPNGVNPERFPVDQLPSRPGGPETFTVGFVGTLKPWHGLPTLVDAFALLHEQDSTTRLLVVGDGPERLGLETSLTARGLLDAVHLSGAVAPEDVPGLLASMDVAVAPYPELSRFYFSPLKVYEYLAAGRPVVASRIGQLADLLVDGVNGSLCPPGDAVVLADTLRRLRADPELRARLGRNGRATVLCHHCWTGVARRILDLAGFGSTLQPSRVATTSIVGG